MVAKKQSRWSILKADAMKEYTPKDPYLFDAVDPPIEIQAPDTIEQTLAFASLLDNAGNIPEREFRALIETICGDSFSAVWKIIRHEKDVVLIPFVQELNDHFKGVPAEDAEVSEIPGKGLDSSS